MTPNVLVLGGNFAGLTAALSVKQELGDDVDVTVVSKSDRFQFNPSFSPLRGGGVWSRIDPICKTSSGVLNAGRLLSNRS
jgi:NADH dehydrogenase FAD-containing subunit